MWNSVTASLAFARHFPDLFERHGVRRWILRPFAERAQAAARHAHIGGIDVAVHVEIGHVAMQALAHQVRHMPNARMSGLRNIVTPSSKLRRSPASTFSRIGCRFRSSMEGVIRFAKEVMVRVSMPSRGATPKQDIGRPKYKE